jgi:formate hydrogenlyase transcriptional activator
MSSARLEALLQISDTIAGTRDLQEVLRLLAPALRRAVDFDYVAVFLHDPEKNLMNLHVIERFFDGPTPTVSIPTEQSPSGRCFLTQQPLIIDDVDSETRFAPEIMAILQKHDIKSCCYQPLTTSVRRLGALSFGSRQAHNFGEAEMPFMRRVANQVAVAIDNACHFEESQRYEARLTKERDRLRILLEVNNAIASRLELHDFLEAVSRCLQRILSHELVSISLYEPEEQHLRLYSLIFPHGHGLIREGLTMPVEGTVLGKVLTSRKPLRISSITADDIPEDIMQLVKREGLKSGAVLPLLVGNRAFGTLEVVSTQENSVSEEDMELLSSLAAQVAIGVANALAYKEIDDLKDRLAEEKLYLEDEIRSEYFDEIIGESRSLVEVLDQVRTVAETDSTVLILGETGTGKELIARAIHNSSPRRNKTFVKLNCSAIPTGLLESELFGHERGAFTGAIAQKIGRLELADRGTLFLDEIGDIPMELQPKLLRALQEREFERLGSNRTIRADIRLLAATHRNLSEMVAAREFRSDLYYRLNVFPIKLPPLRERSDDIPRLVRHFASKHASRMNKQIESIPAETMRALMRWHWPGNIRELENFIERAVILSRGTVLNVPVYELESASPLPVGAAAVAAAAGVAGGLASNSGGAAFGNESMTLEEKERQHILKILRETKGVISGPDGAASRLGLKRTTLQGKMKKLGIDRDSI